MRREILFHASLLIKILWSDLLTIPAFHAISVCVTILEV